MNKLIGRLPEWSKTIDPKYQSNYGDIKTVALDFISLPPEARREEVKDYSEQFCFPRFDLARASGLYLFLRVVFDLPLHQPRDTARTFGGWQHPSVGEETPNFDLSWPVKLDLQKRILTIERFPGYFGKGYDAIGEYDYFSNNFSLRTKDQLESFIIR